MNTLSYDNFDFYMNKFTNLLSVPVINMSEYYQNFDALLNECFDLSRFEVNILSYYSEYARFGVKYGTNQDKQQSASNRYESDFVISIARKSLECDPVHVFLKDEL